MKVQVVGEQIWVDGIHVATLAPGFFPEKRLFIDSWLRQFVYYLGRWIPRDEM